MSNTVFSSEVDQQILDEAAAVLAANGLTVSNVFQHMLNYIAERKQIPPFGIDIFDLETEDSTGPGPEMPDYASMNFKELLAACPLDGIDLHFSRDLPRDIDLLSR